MTYPEDGVPAGSIEPGERALETPEDDAAEQAMSAQPGYEEPVSSDSLEAPEWDAHEQAQIVEYDDDYR